ncbi:MAG: NUDIX hydrolase [Chitinophagaceae bacterium]
MQKIYFNNKPLILTDSIAPEIKNYLDRPDTVFMDELNDQAVNTIVHAMQQTEINAGIFFYKDVQETLRAIKEKFTVIQAGGGLVHYKEKSVLLIFRRGKWDIPKGKLDADEELEVCAIREVEEETGTTNIQSEQLITITYHTYYEKEKHILKETHWFLMSSAEEQILSPQVDEDITKCEWVAIAELASYMENANASVVDVVNAGLLILNIKDYKIRVDSI